MSNMRVPKRKPGKFSQLKPDPLMTKDKFNELEQKLKKLKNVSHPQAVEEVKRLAELGDFSENVEYQLAKGRLRGINNAILKIEYQLNNAVIIEPQKQTNTVQIGHTVTIESDKKQSTYLLLGSSETNPQKGIISHNSPIGAALIGHSVGDTIQAKLANKLVEYKITKIK
ncbi:MAG: transcription elongation factor GreA [Patescibacteria group bacterium]